jgi:topoisomerase IA-like protein
LNPNAINYFEGLEATDKNPVFTRIRGRQISETVVKQIEETSAWGDTSIRTVKNSRKDFVITWAASEPYIWDDESSITAAEMAKLLSEREVYLATMRTRNEEYKASKRQPAAAPAAAGFNF